MTSTARILIIDEPRGKTTRRSRRDHRPSPASAAAIWVLSGGFVLYLSADGGGYDFVVHSQVAIVVWWVVLLGAATGLLPAGRVTRAGWAAVTAFALFVAWTALGLIWSTSFGRTLDDLSLVAGYLGILVLGIGIHRDRSRALRHTVYALSAAIVFVAALALASRVFPGLFPAASQTNRFLPGTRSRVAWPLDYWNALAALLAFGLPLLLASAGAARTLAGRVAAASAIPVVALSGYLTFSRGGLIAAVVAMLAYFAFDSQRIAKLAMVLPATAGSAALIAAAGARPAIENGLTDAAARHQGATLGVLVVLVCLAIAALQAGLEWVLRYRIKVRSVTVSPGQARALLAGATVAVVVAAVVAGVPRRLSHAWSDFKHPTAPALSQNSLARYGTASGNGRYQYWRVAVNYADHHLLTGAGPGTFQLIWLPRATLGGYVQNAHSLYIETLSDLGVVGLLVLSAFLVLVFASAVKCAIQSHRNVRAYAAAAAAALIAFCVSSAYDWNWQVPALPVAFLVLAAAVLAPARHPSSEMSQRGLIRAGAVTMAFACLIAIALPLATTSEIRKSEATSSSGGALAAARTAVELEPGSATAQLQLALVLEQRRDLPGAVAAATRATRDEAANWSAWLTLSRLQAESGHPTAAIAAYRRARSLDPKSDLFAQLDTTGVRLP